MENAIKYVFSPREKLKDLILQLKDISKRYNYIKQFCLKFTREPQNSEDAHWLYCLETNVKLSPLFLLKLANAFTNKKNYLIDLDTSR